MSFSRLFLSFLLCILLFSCVSAPDYKAGSAHLPEFMDLVSNYKPSPNTEYFCFSSSSIPLVYHVVTVKMTDSLNFVFAPIVKEEGNLVVIEGEKTGDFARRTGATIAVNTIPYDYGSGLKRYVTLDRLPCGIFMENGKKLSAPVEKYGAFYIADDKFKITDSQFNLDEDSCKLAVGGFYLILKDGLPYGTYLDREDSRTVFGVSEDGKSLTILVVEGENSSKSRGLSFFQCGEILMRFNVFNALQMDGGGSSSLCINGDNVMNYNVNRKVPLHLAIIDE